MALSHPASMQSHLVFGLRACIGLFGFEVHGVGLGVPVCGFRFCRFRWVWRCVGFRRDAAVPGYGSGQRTCGLQVAALTSQQASRAQQHSKPQRRKLKALTPNPKKYLSAHRASHQTLQFLGGNPGP